MKKMDNPKHSLYWLLLGLDMKMLQVWPWPGISERASEERFDEVIQGLIQEGKPLTLSAAEVDGVREPLSTRLITGQIVTIERCWLNEAGEYGVVGRIRDSSGGHAFDLLIEEFWEKHLPGLVPGECVSGVMLDGHAAIVLY